jgi:hypothetical protein
LSEFGDEIANRELSSPRDTLWGRDRASFGGAFVACYDRARLEEYLEVVDLEADHLRAVYQRR